MKGIYFKIIEFNEASQREGGIVMDGIVRDVYDCIYPVTETGIEELPYEIELRHFNANGYKLIHNEFDISYDDMDKFRIR